MIKKTKKNYAAVYYPPVSRQEELSTILNGLATGLSCVFLTANPVAVYWWLIALIYKNTGSTKNGIIFMILCGVFTLLGLAPSIAAKVINPKSKWSVVNIVFISIAFVIALLLTLGFTALMAEAAKSI